MIRKKEDRRKETKEVGIEWRRTEGQGKREGEDEKKESIRKGT